MKKPRRLWLSRYPICRAVLIATGIVTCGRYVAAQSGYTLTDLGSLPGYGQSVATAINAIGQVGGWVYDDGYNTTRAVLFADGNITNLGTLPKNAFSIATAINSAGHVVGGSAHLNYQGRGFVFRDGSLVDLGTLGGTYCLAYGINALGQIVGESWTSGPLHAFVYSNGRMTDLGTLGGDHSSARAINDAGQIVGQADTDALTFGRPHAFSYNNGRMTDLGALGGSAGISWANAINATGQIVGASGTDSFDSYQWLVPRAFLHSGGRMTNLGTLRPYSASEANGINSSGEVVGAAYDVGRGDNFDNKSAQHAFLYADGRMFDLNDLLVDAPGWVLLHATAINDGGQIVGYGVTPAGDVHAVVLRPTREPVPPMIVSMPASQHVALGSRVTFAVSAVHRLGGNVRYQWKKNGVALANAAGSALTISSAAMSDVGFYSVVVAVGGSSVETIAAILTIEFSDRESRLANISTRGRVSTGGALTPGFVLRGTGTKQLLVRAAGPALAGFGLSGMLADPKLELIRAGSTAPLIVNDDWGTSQNPAALSGATTAVGAFALSTNSKDAAVLAALDTATTGTNYSVRITAGTTAASGLVLAEVYDADPPGAAVQIGNLSTLAVAGAGADALVAGFVIDGGAAKRLLIRAIGPGLASFGVTGALADPKLQLFAGAQLVAENDDWGGAATLASAFASAGAFSLPAGSKDAALLIMLPPGSYTAQVSGAGASGMVLLEVYEAL